MQVQIALEYVAVFTFGIILPNGNLLCIEQVMAFLKLVNILCTKSLELLCRAKTA